MAVLSAHPGRKMPLSRAAIDRDYLARARPQLFDELRSDRSTRIIAVHRGRALATVDGAPTLRFFGPTDLANAETWLYLGRAISQRSTVPDSLGPDSLEPGAAILAAVLDDEAAEALAAASANSTSAESASADSTSAPEWVGIREVGAVLPDLDSGLLVEAIALANWHESHRFSPRTGLPLVAEQGGWVLRAADGATEVFPRTDPAIIVAVLDGEDRLLLGSNALWQQDRFSLLAGFVEPGESLEAAVTREVFEESGVRVVDPVYLGSQPWPFPASLMVGFRANIDPGFAGRLEPDGTEILDVRWFTREELRQDDSVVLPGPGSIARVIIDDWVGSG